MICPTTKGNYFLQEGWTGAASDPRLICPTGQISVHGSTLSRPFHVGFKRGRGHVLSARSLAFDRSGHQHTGAAAYDYAALATRPSISAQGVTKSIGFVEKRAGADFRGYCQ